MRGTLFALFLIALSAPGPSQATDRAVYSTSLGTFRHGASRLIVDTTGKGFQFTDPNSDCITFNLNETLQCYSWPVHASGNGWLVYDRDGSGIISDGSELFGDSSPHADGGVANHPDPNGFLALAWYDQPAQGGDMEILDKRDAIWSKLKIWIDDHCYKNPSTPCVSVPSELHSLRSFGITSISLVYQGVPKTDNYGNRLKFAAVLNPDAETSTGCCDHQQNSSDGRLMYDVYLVQKQ